MADASSGVGSALSSVVTSDSGVTCVSWRIHAEPHSWRAGGVTEVNLPNANSVIVSAPFAESRDTGRRLDLFAKALVLHSQHPDVLFVDLDVLA
ncbi:MAG: hypothetical protein QG597_1710 [Actinomycetota bacterium]|nr:hypothetical protein [Actinomycetota bacterium]